MKEDVNKVLIIGIGNSGREDDGLGWAFLDDIYQVLPTNFDIEYRYQLQIEDTELITHYQKVYFIDAYKKPTKKGFFFKDCAPKDTHSFSTHSLSPETILFLTNSIYNKNPIGFVMGISGESFQLKIGITDVARSNLKDALKYFNQKILRS